VAQKYSAKKTVFYGLVVAGIIAGVYVGRSRFGAAKTIHQLLTENRQLKTAITNLTDEDQIGYAKVLGQHQQDGKLFTTIRFVETDRDDNLKRVLEKDYLVEGDIVHFDALVVKFGRQMVMDGEQKALYLWRRVYGEKTAPEDGLTIEQPGREPQRYRDMLKLLGKSDRELFWQNIWELANDPEKLRRYGIEAVYGNVVYSRLTEGRVYIFKISPAGQVYPEIATAL